MQELRHVKHSRNIDLYESCSRHQVGYGEISYAISLVKEK